MLWDHAHPYIQSTTVLCDTVAESQTSATASYPTTGYTHMSVLRERERRERNVV